MSSKSLALSSPDLLAEYVRESELKSFFEKRLAAPPDHMAMLIRNGEIIDTYKGAHFSIGGIFKSLKSLVVGSSHISILLADLKPFSIQSSFKAITKDNVPVAATATFELQVNPDKPSNVMGLVNTSGYLTHDEVLARFRPHLTDRVVEAAIRKVNADELRGERGLQDHIQAEIMREIERVAGDLGLMVRATSLEWALNDVEREAMEKSVLDREQEKLDQELDYLRRNIQRNTDSTRFQINSDLDIAKLENASEEELEHLVLNRQVRLEDARNEVERRQELESIAHQLEVLKNERVGRFENQIAEAEQLINVANERFKLTRVQLEIDQLQQTHSMEMKKLNAFGDLDISDRANRQNLEHSGLAQRQQVDHLSQLQELEQRGEDAEAARRNMQKQLDSQLQVEKTRADADARVAQLQAGAKMTPEQILAINAGLSSDVANVLVEQARASASNNGQVVEVMQQLVDQANQEKVNSASQAMEMFRTGMNGAAGVAQGVGGAVGAQTGGAADRSDATIVECSKCGREVASKSRFCPGCGNKMRA